MQQRITQELADDAAIRSCARQFGIAGDATRLKICYLLCRHPELSVGGIAKALGTSVSAVSHSLKKMLEAELVERRKSAQTVYYSLGRSEFAHLVTKMIS